MICASRRLVDCRARFGGVALSLVGSTAFPSSPLFARLGFILICLGVCRVHFLLFVGRKVADVFWKEAFYGGPHHFPVIHVPLVFVAVLCQMPKGGASVTRLAMYIAVASSVCGKWLARCEPLCGNTRRSCQKKKNCAAIVCALHVIHKYYISKSACFFALFLGVVGCSIRFFACPLHSGEHHPIIVETISGK